MTTSHFKAGDIVDVIGNSIKWFDDGVTTNLVIKDTSRNSAEIWQSNGGYSWCINNEDVILVKTKEANYFLNKLKES